MLRTSTGGPTYRLIKTAEQCVQEVEQGDTRKRGFRAGQAPRCLIREDNHKDCRPKRVCSTGLYITAHHDSDYVRYLIFSFPLGL